MVARSDISALCFFVSGILSTIVTVIGICLFAFYVGTNHHEVVSHPWLIYGAPILTLPVFCVAFLRGPQGIFGLWILSLWFGYVLFVGPQGSRNLHENLRNFAVYLCIPVFTQIARFTRPASKKVWEQTAK